MKTSIIGGLFLTICMVGACKTNDAPKKDEPKTVDVTKKEEPKKEEPKKEEPKKADTHDDLATGSAECDALVKIQLCLAKNNPNEVKDAARAWKSAISDKASRQMTIDTCKQSLGQLEAAAKGAGC